MLDKYYSLTKTLILSGIQCEKKLWFDLNDKIKLKDKAIFRSGNRFNDVVRKHYGEGLDLSDEKEHQKVIGRAELSNEIKMQGNDPLQVSRQHFTVYSESNKFYIADGTTSVQEKPSSNHTKVNGKDITDQGAIEFYPILQDLFLNSKI